MNFSSAEVAATTSANHRRKFGAEYARTASESFTELAETQKFTGIFADRHGAPYTFAPLRFDLWLSNTHI